MKRLLRWSALGLLLGLLAFAPVILGRLWEWEHLVLGFIASAAALLWAVGALLPKSATAVSKRPSPQSQKRPPKRQSKHEAEPQPLPGEAASVTRRLPGDAIDWALAAFILWHALSWLVSVYRYATVLHLVTMLSYATLFWICRYGLTWGRGGAEGRPRRLWSLAIWALIGGGVLLSVLGLREYVRTVYFLGEPQWRIFGPMLNPNVAAGYLLLTLYPAMALLLGAQSRAEEDDEPRYTEIACGFALLLMLATLLLTGSKAAWAAFLGGAVVFALTGLAGRRRAQWSVLGLALLVLVMAFVLPPLRARLTSAFDVQSHSTIFRLYTWESTLHMIAKRPLLGFGAGTFQYAFPRFAIAGYTRAAHQSFLQIPAEAGLPALLLGLLFGVLLLRRLWNIARARDSEVARYMAGAAIAALVASSLQALFDYPWYIPAVACAFFGLAGLALAPAQTPPPRLTRLPPALSPRRLWQIVAVAALLMLVWTVKNLVAEQIASAGKQQLAAMAYPAASESYARAQRWSPGQARHAVQQSKVEEALAAGGDRSALPRAVALRLRAIKLQPTEPLNYVALARLYQMAGDTASAMAAARRALALYPNYPRGLAELGRLQEAQGDLAGATETYRRLLALREGPVGRYPAVPGITEVAFIYGQIGVADAAWREGRRDAALREWAGAAGALESTLNWEITNQIMTGSGMSAGNDINEITALTEQVLERLRRIDSPFALMRQARLNLELRREDEALEQLRALTRVQLPPSDRRLIAWANLRLAQLLEKEHEQEARTLAAKGLAIAKAQAPLPDEQGPPGWLRRDAMSLRDLQGWAEKFLQSPPK